MAENKARRDIEVLMYRRDNIIQKIDYLHTKAGTLTIDDSPETLSEFRVRCERLNAHYDSFERYQSDIAKLYVQLKETELLTELQTLNKSTDEKYFYILAVKEKFSPSVVKSEHSTDRPGSSSAIKLPKINLPVFEGTLKDWPQFKDLFLALVHENVSLSPIEKFHFLLSSTKGEPNLLVKSLPLCSNNYELVWTQLNERYDNKRLLATQYIDEILNLTPIHFESPKPLRHMLDVLNENTAALKQMDIPDSLADFIILHLVLKNVDKHTRQLFERKFSDKEYPSLSDFSEFLRDHCKALEAAGDTRLKQLNKPIVKAPVKPTYQTTSSLVKRSLHANTQDHSSVTPSCCLFCSQNHPIYQCTGYLKLSPTQRRDFIKSKEACFNCLSASHMLSKCKSTRSCFKCKRYHHTSLHEDNFTSKHMTLASPPTEINSSNLVNTPESTSALTCTTYISKTSHPSPTTTLLGTALVSIKDSTGRFQLVRSLIDAGSQSSFITEECVSRLCLSRQKHKQQILGLSETSISSNKGSVLCLIKPRLQTHPILQTTAIILNRITSSLPSVTLNQEVKEYFKGWDLADPEFNVPGKVEFLIGADLFPELFEGGRSETPQGIPTAFRTIFGWLLIGETSLPSPSIQPVSVNLAIFNHQTLESSLKGFWEIEEPPASKRLSPEDEICESIYSSTVKRQPSGRFVVNLPFRNKSPDLGESYEKARGCLFSLERKFEKSPELRMTYCNFMKEYEDLGHMTKINPADKQAYYIPHHGIFKNTNATSPKLRVVFNASSQTSSSRSLNDELLVGPKLQTDICKILSLFRLHTYVFTTDIEKMYRQILVNPDQRKYQAILWRYNPEESVSTYLLNTVTYGVTTSPFLALRTLKQLALENSSQFPLANEVVLNTMFVDDILTGGDSLEYVKTLKFELINLLGQGGFELRKWSSNSPELLKDVPSHHQELVFQENKMDDPSIKVLGLKWKPVTDVFSYDVHLENVPPTKRNILSQISRVYDPLGLITPVVLFAKCLIQKIWTLGLEWDQPLPSDLVNQAIPFFENLPLLSQLAIPRLVLPSDCVSIQIHGYADASCAGYGCSVYLRTIQKNGIVSVNLLMAKSKVAPLKTVSIPRLELCGALLLCKTMNFCHETVKGKLKNVSIHAWTDSMITLHWIRSSPHQLKTFVANRVAQIQSFTDPSVWRHTPTTSNPADYASRGLQPFQILKNSLWWNGPDWLMKDESHWPDQPLPVLPIEESLFEYRSTTSLLTVVPDQTISDFASVFERFSSFNKLQACFGFVLRFINNCQKAKRKIDLPFLTALERASALRCLVKVTQSLHFSKHINLISAKKPCPPFLQRLDPFLDKKGLLRVGGRLKHAQVSFDSKYPLLLPKHSTVTHLLIDHFHLKYLHAGPRALQSLLTQQFWVISARQVIRQRLSKCLLCKRVNGKSIQPYMGNLPAARLRQTRPFLSVGVDFGGPYLTKSGVTRKPHLQKGYICLFVCFSTKAVHLELVSSLSTEAFLAALDRFVSRRGLCTDIYSDQGTNFIGADRELKEIYNLLTQPDTSKIILSKLSNLGVNWHFNPPAAPHFGGLWESGIKSTKYHLKRSLGSQVLTFEEFATLLSKIEAILNSRPLCSLSPDPNEFDTLTPGHFLIGEPLVALPQPDFTSMPINRLSRWQLVQQAQRSFWNTWSREYLHQLQQRPKWIRQERNLMVGDLVLVKEKTLPPLSWISARVVETHPGEDGIVRVVSLKTPTGQLKRPVTQLSPLLYEE